MRHAFTVVCVLVFPVLAQGVEPSKDELEAAAALRTSAIKNAASRVADLEKAKRQTGSAEKKNEITESIKEAKREYNRLKARSVEDFAAEVKNPKPPAPKVEAKQNPFMDGPAVQPAQQPAVPKRRARTVEEIMEDIAAKEKVKAEAMKGLTVRWPYSRVWAPLGGNAMEFGLCEILFDGAPPTQGFFKVGEAAEQVVIESTDANVAEPVRDEKHIRGPYFFLFKQPGKARLTVRVGKYALEHEIEVKGAPVAVGDKTDSVIKQMGLPSHKSAVFVKWPNTEEHDGFIYTPEAGDPFSGEHWFFADYQDLLLSVEDGQVKKIGTNRKRTASQVELRAREPNAQ